jgi:NAD(P)-dependent dehydrogenase (short-subunit alcohol dehydrogenase family)
MEPTEHPIPAPAALPVEPVATPEHAHEVHAETPASPVSGSDVVAVAGQNPLLAFGLALVALFAGGGAGWKWWSKRSEAASELARLQAEQSHELALKQLELSTGSATVQPPPCHAKQLEVEAKLSAIVADVASVQTDISTLQRAVRELRKTTKVKA